MKKASFILVISLVVLFYLPCLAEDSEYGRIVGDRKYFVEDPARGGVGNPAKGGGRDYIVRNPRATLPPPAGIPSCSELVESMAKMGRRPPVWVDSTQQECWGWGEDTPLAVFQYQGFFPRVAVSGESIHVVWLQGYSAKYYREEIFYKRSIDDGITWADSVVLSDPDGKSSVIPDIAIAREGRNVYVVWHDWCSYQNCGIYFRKSTNGGETWLPAVGIALAGPDYYFYYGPTIAAKDSEVYVVYCKESLLRSKKSTNCGDTWGEEVVVSETGGTGGYPANLAINSEGLHLVSQHSVDRVEIFYNRSTDFGDTWESFVPVSELDDHSSQWPSIGADDLGNVYITWFDYKYSPYPWTGDIFLRQSTNNGESWLPVVFLTDEHKAVESDVYSDGQNVHVVWHDERQGSPNSEIYYKMSSNQGATWLDEDRLTETPYQSGDPRITTYHNTLHLAWIDSPGDNYNLFYKKGGLFVPGDVTGDMEVTINDVVYILNYLFIGGPAPNIFRSGDANGDEEINITDVIYLINYLFVGGPPPAEC